MAAFFITLTNSARRVKFGVLVFRPVSNIHTQCVRSAIEVNDHKFGEKSNMRLCFFTFCLPCIVL